MQWHTLIIDLQKPSRHSHDNIIDINTYVVHASSPSIENEEVAQKIFIHETFPLIMKQLSAVMTINHFLLSLSLCLMVVLNENIYIRWKYLYLRIKCDRYVLELLISLIDFINCVCVFFAPHHKNIHYTYLTLNHQMFLFFRFSLCCHTHLNVI